MENVENGLAGPSKGGNSHTTVGHAYPMTHKVLTKVDYRLMMNLFWGLAPIPVLLCLTKCMF